MTTVCSLPARECKRGVVASYTTHARHDRTRAERTIMRVDTAVKLVNDLVFRPGWKITAEDYSHRHEGTICVSFEYDTRNFVGDDMDTAEELYFALLKRIERINSHEDREALRVASTKWSPFYPHKVDGQK